MPLQEIVQEQITRVLLERLIVNRPHPWGLLITFIELIKNPRCVHFSPRQVQLVTVASCTSLYECYECFKRPG